jgi:nitroreductase
MELRDALRTTGAVREWLPESVPDDVVYRILETARFAPSGGNRQGWAAVLVKDPDTRARLRDLYQDGWYHYLAQRAAGLVPFAPSNDPAAERDALSGVPAIAEAATSGGGGFAEHLNDVPVMLVVLADLKVLAALDKGLDRYTFAGGASVYPFAWSVLLAARDEGLAGVMTTMLIRREPEVRELLGVPGTMAVAGLLALGRPVRQPRRLARKDVEEFTTVDRLDGRPFKIDQEA